MPTVPLRRFAPPPLRLDVAPLGRLAGGRLHAEEGLAAGEGLLVLWRPGERPAFRAVRGRLAREGVAWRWEGEPAEGWVVLWVAGGPPRQPLDG